MPELIRKKKKMSSFEMIAFGFAGVILLGAIILMLPISSSAGKSSPCAGGNCRERARLRPGPRQCGGELWRHHCAEAVSPAEPPHRLDLRQPAAGEALLFLLARTEFANSARSFGSHLRAAAAGVGFPGAIHFGCGQLRPDRFRHYRTASTQPFPDGRAPSHWIGSHRREQRSRGKTWKVNFHTQSGRKRICREENHPSVNSLLLNFLL